MKKIEFDNPVFHHGLNYTVRVGTKWAKKLEPGMMVNLNNVTVGKINRITVCYFPLIDQNVYNFEHDPKCRTWFGLWTELSKIYGVENRKNTVVTCIGFYVDDKFDKN